MIWKNTNQHFGLISKLAHWLSAIVIFVLFILGYWMMELDYYSEWYQTAPHWHQSIGILLLIATLFRLFWLSANAKPSPISSHSTFVVKSSLLMHKLLYILLISLMFSGYLITTADDRSVAVFDWFEIPSFGALFENQEDMSGVFHKYAAYVLIALSIFHAVAAVKHHFIDKDETLMRMFK